MSTSPTSVGGPQNNHVLTQAFGTKGTERYHHVWPKPAAPAAPAAAAAPSGLDGSGLDAVNMFTLLLKETITKAAQEGRFSPDMSDDQMRETAATIIADAPGAPDAIRTIAEQYQRDTGRTASLDKAMLPGDAVPVTAHPFYIQPPSMQAPTLEPKPPTWSKGSRDSN